MLGEISAVLSIWNWLKKNLLKREPPQTESVATRFVSLFESHGVHRNQIPRYFGYGLSLQDVQDDVALMAALDETLLEAACEHFAVRREWLDGAEPQVHPCHDFYKDHERFADFLGFLKEERANVSLRGVLVAPIVQDQNANALLILEEAIGELGEKEIYRYHLCNNWDFSYWKSRAYLTACVAIGWQRKVYVHGRYADQKEINVLSEGKMLLGWHGEGIWSMGYKRWHPEDMALNPNVFLEGVDPERDKFGYKAGLSLWLRLEEEGWMRTGFDENVRHLFQQELSRYN